MPQVVAPLVVGGLSAATVGQALAGVAVSFGVSYIAKELQPKPNNAPISSQGMKLQMSYDPNGPREFAFGRVASAGTLEYHNTYGPNGNDYLQLVTKLADLPCKGLVTAYVDGMGITLGSDVSTSDVSGTAVTQYPGTLWFKFHEGDWSQAADSDLAAKATGTAWSSNNRGRGVCYKRTTAKYDAEKFKNGRPAVLTVFDGAKLYDWRKDSTNGGSGAHRWGQDATYEFSNNPAVVLYNYMRGLYVNGNKAGGMNVPAENLPVATWTAAANACDENVPLKAGGTEKRYKANGIFALTGEHATFIRDILATMAGDLVDAGGDFKLYAGVSRSPVMTVTDDDIVSGRDVVYSPRLPRPQLVNEVFGSFTDPYKAYQTMALPPRISPSDQTADGGNKLSEHYALKYVTSQTQGQRILEIFRRRGRFQRSISLTLRASFCLLEAGDWVTFNSTRYGFSSVLFQVVRARTARDLTTSVELREVSASIYAWTAASDELNPLDPADVGSGAAKFTTVSGIALSNLIAPGAGAQQRPMLKIEWTPITDPTVTDLKLEYRVVGSSTPAGVITILDPSEGHYEWLDAVQGGLEYEARLLPVTQPPRATVWSGWAQVPDNSPPQIVAVADLATDVPDNTITPIKLSAQARLELGLVTAADGVLGSVAERILRIEEESAKAHIATIESVLRGHDNATQIRVEKIERVAEDLALAQQITTISAQINNTILAALQEEQTARVTADSALAQSIGTAVTRLDGNEVAVVALQESLNGIEGRWGVAINANGQVVGLVQLDGAATGSSFTVVVDNFKVAKPGTAGGAAVPVFAIQTVNGQTKIALRGDMIADGTISATKLNVVSLAALTANIGDANFTGVMRGGAGGKLVIDLNNGIIRGVA